MQHEIFMGIDMISDSEDGGQDTLLPPGVTQEDFDLFKQAQERAQDLLTKVCFLAHVTSLGPLFLD